VGRSFGVGVFVLGIHILTALVMLIWWAQAPSLGGRHWAGLGLMVVVGVCAWWHWWRSPVGVLQWDGQQWHWGNGAVFALLEPPVVCLDLQRYVLLRAQVSGVRMVWLHLEQSSFPQRWLDLRRAVYSPAGATASPVRGARPGSVHPPGP